MKTIIVKTVMIAVFSFAAFDSRAAITSDLTHSGYVKSSQAGDVDAPYTIVVPEGMVAEVKVKITDVYTSSSTWGDQCVGEYKLKFGEKYYYSPFTTVSQMAYPGTTKFRIWATSRVLDTKRVYAGNLNNVPFWTWVYWDSWLYKVSYTLEVKYSKSSGFELTKSGDGVILDGYFDSKTVLSIPSTIDGVPVKHIGNSAFKNCKSLKSVVIPDGVESIGYSAFQGCTSLESVTIPASVKTIGSDAFFNCKSLKSVTIPTSVKGIVRNVFRGCEALADADGFVIINGCLFDYFGSSENVVIPNGVVAIGNYVFEDCTSLKSLTIPASLESVGVHAFLNCKSIKRVNISDLRAWCGIIWEDSVYSSPFRYTRGDLYLNGSIVSDLRIPSTVSRIGNAAFYGCNSIKRVVIPDTIKSIGENAFSKTSIENVSLPEGLADIKENVFYDCTSLKSVVIPQSVTRIGKRAFCGCASLKNLEIPRGVTHIGESAFSGCTSLEEIAIPDSVTDIGEGAFDKCWSLADSDGFVVVRKHLYDYCGPGGDIVVPAVVQSIGEYCFYRDEDITGVTIPSGMKSIGRYAFEGCGSLVRVSVPGSVTNIGAYAFARCALLKEVSMPVSDVEIGEEAFDGCKALVDGSGFGIVADRLVYYSGSRMQVSIPQGVKRIEAYVFSMNRSIWNVSIPDSVTHIGDSAFSSCRWLDDVVIPKSVKHIGDAAFFGCEGLEDLEISDGVEQIGEDAFYGCSNLENMVIPDSVKNIGNGAFSGCEKLADANGFIIVRNCLYGYIGSKTAVTIPENVTDIAYGAFDSTIVGVTIPDAVTNLHGGAFIGCESLEEIVIPKGVKRIPVNAFYGCTSLRHVVVPDSVISIDKSAFYMCHSLQSINIPEEIRHIGERAFYNCISLPAVTLPSTLQSIGEEAFRSCDILRNVEIPESVTDIGKCAFADCNSVIHVRAPLHLKDEIESNDVFVGAVVGLNIEYFLRKVVVVFDANGGTVSEIKRAVGNGSAIGTLPTATRVGYSFLGWFTAPEGGTKISAATKVTDDAAYYAQWRANAYTVRFHRNCTSSDVTVKDQSFTYGRGQELSWISGGLKWSNPNHAFMGWATSANGPVVYANGQSVANLASAQGAVVHLYAVWRYIGPTYTVRYHKYDGSGATRDQTFKIGEGQNLLWISGGLKWSRPGYEFIGWVPWNPDAKARLCKYVNGQVVKDIGKKDEIVHLYAAWKSASSYRVCFHRNTGASDAVTMNQVILRNKEDQLAWLDSQMSWTRPGYVFKGWSERADSEVVKYTNGATVRNLAMNGGTKHLYAVWRVNTYTVRYYKYDGSGTTRDQIFTVGKAQNLLWKDSQLKWSRPGYEFVGWVPWNPDAKPRLCRYINGQNVKDIGAPGTIIHLYAAWKSASSYRVCFHRNTGASDTVTMNQVILRNRVGQLAWLDSQMSWTRPGYVFRGWSERADSDVVKYANGATVKNLAMNGGTKHLYAVWRTSSSAASASSCAMRFVQPLSAGVGSRHSAPVQSPEPHPGHYFGVLADGTGTYDLLVDEGGETGYVNIVFEDGTAVSEEVDVDFLDDNILVTDETGEMYVLLVNASSGDEEL